MRKAIGLLAVVLATTGAAHEEEMLAEERAKLSEARAKMAEAARELARATRDQFVARSDGPMLGVLIADQDERGVVVGGVTPDGGAEAAGIVADDIITGIDGEALTGMDRPIEKLRAILDGVESGDPVTLVVLRDGELSEVDVVTTTAYRGDLVPRFDFDWLQRADFPGRVAALRSRLEREPDEGGLKLADIGEDLGDYFGVDAGVLVLNTPAGSDLRPGDIVRRVDGADVGSSDEAYRLLRGDGDAAVEVRRKNRSTEVVVARQPHRGGVFVFRSGDDEPHEEEVEVHVREAR